MASLKKREKIMLIVLAALILFYLYYAVFLTPMIGTIGVVNASVKKYSAEADKIKNAETIISQQRAEIEGLKDKLNEALASLPQVERNPEIAYNLKKMAEANGVSLTGVGFGSSSEVKPQEQNQQGQSPQGQNQQSTEGQTQSPENQQQNQGSETPKTNTGKKLFTVPVSIKAEGNYPALMNYIASLEKDKRITQIISVNFSSQQGKITADINVCYFYSEEFYEGENEYDFNKGTYGKPDLFK